jgi:hypothetical protein
MWYRLVEQHSHSKTQVLSSCPTTSSLCSKPCHCHACVLFSGKKSRKGSTSRASSFLSSERWKLHITPSHFQQHKHVTPHLDSEASSLPDMYTFDLGIKKYSDKPIEGHCMIQLTNELQECYDLKRQRHCCRFTDIEET